MKISSQLLLASCLAAPVLFASAEPVTLRFFNVKSLRPMVVSTAACQKVYKPVNHYSSKDRNVVLPMVAFTDPRRQVIHEKNGLVLVEVASVAVGLKAGKKTWHHRLHSLGVKYPGGHVTYGSYSDGYCAGNYTLRKA